MTHRPSELSTDAVLLIMRLPVASERGTPHYGAIYHELTHDLAIDTGTPWTRKRLDAAANEIRKRYGRGAVMTGFFKGEPEGESNQLSLRRDLWKQARAGEK